VNLSLFKTIKKQFAKIFLNKLRDLYILR